MKRSISLLGSACLVALPLAALTTGCSGGTGGPIGNPTATPIPTLTGTPVPTATSVSTNLGSAPVTFGNGQTGTLNLSRSGSTITGTLVVAAAPTPADAKARSTKAFTFFLPAGTYTVSGTVNISANPITFNITGNFPAPVGAFSILGTIPTTTTNGTYTISAGGQTVSGTYPKIGTVPTPIPTITTPPIGIGGTFNLTLTQSSNSNFGLSSFAPNSIAGTRTTSGLISVGANFNAASTSQSKTFVLLITPGTALKAGDTLTLGPTGLSRASITVGGFSGGSVTSWNTTGGTLQITAISNTSISATLTNAVLQPSIASAAQGTLTFNGTFQANLALA